MKKLTAILLSLAMVFSLAACSSGGGPSSGSNSAEPSGAESSQPTGQEESGTGTGNTLVVYFSATGNTQEAANYIAQLTGGDLFELVPSEPYTDEDLNWTNDNSRVSQEYYDETLRDVGLVRSR